MEVIKATGLDRKSGGAKPRDLQFALARNNLQREYPALTRIRGDRGWLEGEACGIPPFAKNAKDGAPGTRQLVAGMEPKL
jgi:hypothetical protein